MPTPEADKGSYLETIYPVDGVDASRRAIRAAVCHSLSVRRFAPAIKRLRWMVVHASMLTHPLAADPRVLLVPAG